MPFVLFNTNGNVYLPDFNTESSEKKWCTVVLVGTIDEALGSVVVVVLGVLEVVVVSGLVVVVLEVVVVSGVLEVVVVVVLEMELVVV
ncbi:MAG: hypothetical protein EBU90_04125 [Proteobacteria bacterium]|nr:hypothetical protein [Pseudomonadota bacterium]NBP13920.1 hypothetical protein [bacterium]